MASFTTFEAQTPARQAGPERTIRDLLQRATGVEVACCGDKPIHCPTCLRHCIQEDGGAQAEGACEIVRALFSGKAIFAEQCPAVCEKGYPIAILDNMETNRPVLVLDPCPEHSTEGLSPAADRLRAAAELWDRCRQLSDESSGLATEVIRCYEQLNVLFDITQQICKARNSAQIKLFLLRRLAETLECHWSCCLSGDDGVLWWCGDGQNDRNETISEIRECFGPTMEDISQRGTVEVKICRESKILSGHMIFGSLTEEEAGPNIMVFGRRDGHQEFVSGDMMMIDSVLNHAEHVLNNVRLSERLKTMSFEAVRALTSAIDKKDRYTSGHSERVGLLSRLIGEQMGLSAEELQDLEWGGVLHDVGKIGIQDGILTKPGKLTDEEYEQIKQHSTMSYEIIAPIMSFASVQDIVLYHHEVPDGSGYPRGLKGKEIPLPARIVHVADSFDALTSCRSYREAFSLVKALSILREESGTKFDPEAVIALEKGFRKFRDGQPDLFAKVFAHIKEQEK